MNVFCLCKCIGFDIYDCARILDTLEEKYKIIFYLFVWTDRDIGANFMNILSDTEQDSEITTYVMTLINKVNIQLFHSSLYLSPINICTKIHQA